MCKRSVFTRVILVAAATGALGGCATVSYRKAETDERQCLARAMFFESNRSSDQGMMAVGTVVMNRRESGRYPRTICGVVGQTRQFAPGALTRGFSGAGKARALRNADRVLGGARQPGLQGVYHFHTAGYKFPYTNMYYVQVAGGNAFYQKRPGQLAQNTPPPPIESQGPGRVPAPVPPADMQPAEVQVAMAPSVPMPPRPSRARVAESPMDEQGPAPSTAAQPLPPPVPAADPEPAQQDQFEPQAPVEADMAAALQGPDLSLGSLY